jgi:Ca2+-binding EF-hand superfamily protein
MNKIFAYSIAATLLAGSSVALAHGPGGECHGGGAGKGQHFTEMDANKDGAVSKDEFVQKHAARFDQADTNKDGKLTQEERSAAHEARMKQRMAEHEQGEPITRDQMKQKSAEHFAKLDANGDGKITQDELANGHHGRGGRHQQ